MADDCLFCKIIKGEIPCDKVFENDQTCIFLEPAHDQSNYALLWNDPIGRSVNVSSHKSPPTSAVGNCPHLNTGYTRGGQGKRIKIVKGREGYVTLALKTSMWTKIGVNLHTLT